jgi:hypothetical protein
MDGHQRIIAIESGGVLSTRFRFMIALPLMATFFALSFRPFARRYSQAFIIAFGVVAMTCTYMSVYLIAADSPFRIDNGNGTMKACSQRSCLLDLSLRRMPSLSCKQICHCRAARAFTKRHSRQSSAMTRRSLEPSARSHAARAVGRG